MITSTSTMSAANVIGADIDWAVTYRLPTTPADQVLSTKPSATHPQTPTGRSWTFGTLRPAPTRPRAWPD